ncbi:MAG: hypothetical protein IPG92_04415 [Flavobacteriales bacterium]|nr:hypothetical protein [Flavobacteriales bacterium]
MKVLLDIKDEKAASLLEILRGLAFVKTKPLSDEKALLLLELKEAVDEMKLVKTGKKKGRKIEDLLDEL